MKIRIRDIASKAGVSPATVSNALNGKPGVSREVARSIIETAREMGYTITKTHVEEQHYIRMVLFKVHGQVLMDTQFFGDLTESIQRECRSAGLELMISHINASTDQNWLEQVHKICREECSGIILLATEMNSAELEEFRNCASPLLVLDNLCRHDDFHAVCMNNYTSGYKATEHLIQVGHKQIGHISSSVAFSNTKYRNLGYQTAMKSFDLADQIDCWAVRPTINGAYEDMCTLLDSGRKLPTAFFACNDIVAVAAIRAMKERGISVPEDVSIIGMDDTDLCLACMPQLSTMRVNRKGLGITAVRMLLNIIPEITSGVLKTELDVDLIQRDSVRALNE